MTDSVDIDLASQKFLLLRLASPSCERYRLNGRMSIEWQTRTADCSVVKQKSLEALDSSNDDPLKPLTLAQKVGSGIDSVLSLAYRTGSPSQENELVHPLYGFYDLQLRIESRDPPQQFERHYDEKTGVAYAVDSNNRPRRRQSNSHATLRISPSLMASSEDTTTGRRIDVAELAHNEFTWIRRRNVLLCTPHIKFKRAEDEEYIELQGPGRVFFFYSQCISLDAGAEIFDLNNNRRHDLVRWTAGIERHSKSSVSGRGHVWIT